MRRRRHAFTLVELFVVMVVMLILMGLLFPAVSRAVLNARNGKAKAKIKLLQVALVRYKDTYGVYPLHEVYSPSGTTPAPPQGQTLAPTEYDTLLEILNGTNKRGIRFLTLDTKGKFTDTWGEPFQVRIDFDYDSNMTNGWPAPTTLYAECCIWSKGLDEVSMTADDVVSWEW